MIRLSPTLQAARVWEQVQRNLSGMTFDMRANAQTWRANAQAGSVPVATLRTWINDAGRSYLQRLQWIADWRADKPARWAAVVAVAASQGVSDTELRDLAQDAAAIGRQMRDATPNTHAAVIVLCDAILAEVPAAESLWPE